MPESRRVEPAYAGWQNLAIYSGMSVRWLKGNVPRHLRINPGGGKIVVKLAAFDEWFQGFTQETGDLDRLVEKIHREVTGTTPLGGRVAP